MKRFMHPGRCQHQTVAGVTHPRERVRASDVAEIADRVARLTIHRHDPERFFEERSEIAQELREMAHALRAGR